MSEEQEKTIEEYKKEAEEYLNGWKRAKADMMNYQKQVDRERAEWAMFANASCVKAILPVLDSLEMATQSVISTEAPTPQEGRSGEISHGTSMQGVRPALPAGRSIDSARDDGLGRIRDQMVDVLRQMGVEAIKAVGEPVNPEFHEVVATETSEEHASGLITKEAQRGYTMHGRVLRAAKVIVSE